MKIFVVNSGSSSVKFELIDMPSEEVFVRGVVGDIGLESSYLELKHPEKRTEKVKCESHEDAFRVIFSFFQGRVQVEAAGHRIVHGGEEFTGSVVLDGDSIERLKKYIPYAPLHMPYNIEGVEACSRVFRGIKQVGVFDTAFHHNMPDVAKFYAIPLELQSEHGIRRFGFHGISYRFIVERLREMGKEKGRVVICHLGNGASLAAVLDGRSLDTSMGFTPLEGLVMGTRSGDIDVGVAFFLMREKGYSWKDVDRLLNKESGLKGLSGRTYEMREIEELMEKGDERARFAFDMFCYRLSKYIASYGVPLGGIDRIIFTGGIGENSFRVRERVCSLLGFLGVSLDKERNKGGELVISSKHSRIELMVIPTNEELMIAKDCYRLLSG